MDVKLVSEIMTKDPGWLDPEESIETAWKMMRKHRVRHVPVCKNEGLVGLITQKDLLANAQQKSVLTLPVAEIMVMDVRSIEPDMTARSAAKIMRDSKISCLPIVDKDKLVGIVTDSDFLDLVIELLD